MVDDVGGDGFANSRVGLLRQGEGEAPGLGFDGVTFDYWSDCAGVFEG